VLTIVRGAMLVLQRPLLGVANSYDEVRYSSCLDMAPVRPGVPEGDNNPQAPLRLFWFFDGFSRDVCVWTSDLLFTAPVAAGWKVAEALGTTHVHSIGKLGALRLLVWCVAALGLLRAWIRRERLATALALLAVTGVVFFDPAITLFFSTWYAEPAAALGLYLSGAAATLAIAGGSRAIWFCATLMVLLPNSSHPEQAAARIGLDAGCAAHAGPHGAWGIAQPISESCPSMVEVSTPRAWFALIADPPALARALGHIPQWVLPWISPDLGMIEGEQYAHLPASQWSLDRVLGNSVPIASLLLVLPWIVLAAVLLARAGPEARVYAAMCAVSALEIPVVAMFGDGYSDFAKHTQLAVAASLASLGVPLAWLAPRTLLAKPDAQKA